MDPTAAVCGNAGTSSRRRPCDSARCQRNRLERNGADEPWRSYHDHHAIQSAEVADGGNGERGQSQDERKEYVWHCHMLEHEEHDMMRPASSVMSARVNRIRRCSIARPRKAAPHPWGLQGGRREREIGRRPYLRHCPSIHSSARFSEQRLNALEQLVVTKWLG